MKEWRDPLLKKRYILLFRVTDACYASHGKSLVMKGSWLFDFRWQCINVDGPKIVIAADGVAELIEWRLEDKPAITELFCIRRWLERSKKFDVVKDKLVADRRLFCFL